MDTSTDRSPRLPQNLLLISLVPLLVLAVLAFEAPAHSLSSDDWLQFGGPQRNFSSPAVDLAEQWPEDGPKLLWRRPLGDHGHATILAEGYKLYTYFRRGEQDVLLSVNGETGETLWEAAYDSPLTEGFNTQFGPGPHSTPAIGGDRVFTVSSTLVLKAWNKNNGEILWSRDLKDELQATTPGRGFGASPLLYRDLLILPVGGDGQAIVAFSQKDGSVVWKALDGGASYSSPVMANFGGTEQVVVSFDLVRAGLNPATGAELWRVEVPSTGSYQMSMMSVVEDRVFASQAYEDGTRVFKVVPQEPGHPTGFEAEEVLYSRKMKVMHGTTAILGDLAYGSSGDFGPAFLTALDIKTGEVAFRQRGFAKANLMAIGTDRLLILDEDGELALAKPIEGGLEILTSAEILEATSWSAPTLVGTTLFVSNRNEMASFDLSREGNAGGNRRQTSKPEVGSTATDLAATPPRSRSGKTLAIPDAQLDAGSPYFLMRGGDTQVTLTLRTDMQRVVATTGRAAGYLVRPHDLDKDNAPLVGAGFRIPIHSLKTGAETVDATLASPTFLNAAEFPDLGFMVTGVGDWTRRPSDSTDINHFETTLKANLEARGQSVPIEFPATVSYYAFSESALVKTFADLAILQWKVSVPLADLGIEVPGRMMALYPESLELDAFLTFDNTNTETHLLTNQELYLQQSRFETLTQDEGKVAEGYALARKLAGTVQDNPEALTALARSIVFQDIDRDLPFALEVAQQAVKASGGKDAMALSAVARTYFLMGDYADAVKTQKLALEQVEGLPPSAGPRDRRSQLKAAIEKTLKTYESAAN